MNDTIFFFFYNLAHHSILFDDLVIFIGSIFPYIVVFLAFVFLLFHHEVLFAENPFKAFIQKWKEIVLIFLSGTLAWLVSYILKFLFHMSRPYDLFPKVIPLFSETGYSFPSGHATFFMALAFALFFNHKKVGYIFIVFAFLIGICRIIAGVHFPIDILGGFILGYAIAFFLKNV
jgi:undecaprenyl-diphosphatase